MSRRNKPLEKKARAMERAIRKGRLPSYLSLVEWLKDHGHADTTGNALKLIRDGRVMSESHVLDGSYIVERDELNEESGKTERVKERKFSVLVPAAVRPTLRVTEAGADA